VAYKPEEQTIPQLLADWAAMMNELRLRDIIRTNNNPVGDIAEAIVAKHYEGERGSFSQAGWDVKTPDGERIQVKAIRSTPTTRRRNASPIRDRAYDSVVIVVLDENFQVLEGLKLSRETVEELSTSGLRERANHHGHGGSACQSSRGQARPPRRSDPPGHVAARSHWCPRRLGTGDPFGDDQAVRELLQQVISGHDEQRTGHNVAH
jgi:hypothetical protein